MKRVSEDFLNMTVTYELPDGKWVTLDVRDVRELGLAECMRLIGVEPPAHRLDVVQYGEVVGSVPATFDPVVTQSLSPLYDPRSGDFVRDGDAWIANKMLGGGDLEAIPGFRWKERA